MDLQRHIRLLWRSKLLIAAGAIVGILLGVLASYKISGSSLQPRKQPEYTAVSKLMVTQNGFPWGRTTLPGSTIAPNEASGDSTDAGDAKAESSVQFADPGRLANLAWMYSHFLMGDQVRSMITHPPEGMIIDAAPITAGGNMSASALPLIGLTVSAPTAAEAQRLSREVPAALERYLAKEQSESSTPAGDRVEITTINRSQAAIPGKSKAMIMSIVIFMMAVAAAISLAYVLENLRLSNRNVEVLPDRRPVEAVPEPVKSPIHGRSDSSADAGWASGPPSPPTRLSSGSR
jgi:capsular polysaccharide biosynthesis protein